MDKLLTGHVGMCIVEHKFTQYRDACTTEDGRDTLCRERSTDLRNIVFQSS